jgi:uncharacterized Zn-binding protein involved in type VI secretion
MTRRVIRLGDPTSHDGQVIASGAPHYTVDGIGVALKGDACSCPKKGHTNCVIAEGDPGHTSTACRWLTRVTRPAAGPH